MERRVIKRFGSLILVFLSIQIFAQQGVHLECYPDSLLVNDPFEITLVIDNIETTEIQELPEIKGLEVIAGPNRSQSISIFNGQKKSNLKITYFVVATEEGFIKIKPLKIKEGEKVFKTDALELAIHPNPNGIKRSLSQQRKETLNLLEEFDAWPTLPEKPHRKRRKVTRL